MKPKVIVVREKEVKTKTVYVDRPVYIDRPVPTPGKSQDMSWQDMLIGFSILILLVAAVLVLACVAFPKLTIWVVCGVALALFCLVVSVLEKK
jgi:hypothetical protein